jgi:hypothetical protein
MLAAMAASNGGALNLPTPAAANPAANPGPLPQVQYSCCPALLLPCLLFVSEFVETRKGP